MKGVYKKIFIAGVILGAAGALAAIFLMKEDGPSEVTKAGPEDTVKEFTTAMKEGDFEKAYSLCDTTLMKDYMDTYIQEWEKKAIKDSSSFSMITSILGNMTMTIDEIENKDGMCLIEYTLRLKDHIRACKATAKKEKGEWKIAAITDKI